MSGEGETRRKRGRRWAILGILLALLILGVLLLPVVAAPLVKGRVEDAIERELAVEATIGDLSFTLGGSVTVERLRLVDGRGRLVASLDRLDASVGVLRALGGTIALDALARGLAVHLYEEEDGTWSVEDLPRGREREPDEEGGEPGTLDLRGSARLADAVVVFTRRDGSAMEAELQAAAAFAGPDRPATIEGSLALSTGGVTRLEAEIPGDLARLLDPARMQAAGSLRFDPPTDLGALGSALAGLLPFDLRGGRLSGAGEMRLGPALDLALDAEIALESLSVAAGADAPPLALERVTLAAETAPTDGVLVPRVTLSVDRALEVVLEGRLSGAGGPDAALEGTLALEGDVAELERIAATFAPSAEPRELAGRLAGRGAYELALADGALARADGDLTLTLEDASSGSEAVEGNSELVLKARYDAAAEAVDVPSLALTLGPGLVMRGSARVEGLAADRTPDASVDLLVRADPSELPPWARAALGETRIAGEDVTVRVQGGLVGGRADGTADLTGRGLELAVPGSFALALGSARVELTVAGPLDAIGVRGTGELLDVDLETVPAPAEEGAEPARGIRVRDPRVALELDLALAPEAGDLDLRRARLESQTATGDLKGRVLGLSTLRSDAPAVRIEALEGDFVYVPERLAAALGPLLPGELTGARPEPLAFRLEGVLRGLDAASAVSGLSGTVDAGVGRYVQAGLDVAGRAHVELADGRAQLTSALRANGGELQVAGELAVAPGERGLVAQSPRIHVGAEDVAANASMGPLLGFVHPAFAGLDALARNELGGLIDCEVDLRYEGALDVATLARGWDALPKEPIQGSVTFRLDEGVLVGSPLVQDLLSKLDLGGERAFALEPIRLEVEDGRVSNPVPWEWTLAGAATSFTGSIGLDRTLDFEWSIPITADLASKSRLLRPLEGQTIRVPLSGTITRPKLDTEGLVSSLAGDALREGLREVVGGGKGGSGEDAASLLREADRLWDAGDRKAAAEIYQRIEDDYKLSLVYLTNKSRIKDRADWKP